MLHHSTQNYAESVSAAAVKAREKLEEVIHNARASALRVVGEAQSRVITDTVAKAPAIEIEPKFASPGFTLRAGGGGLLDLHDHAFGQYIQTTRLGMAFVKAMLAEDEKAEWPKFLIARAANEVMSHRAQQRHLIRQEDNTVKGFLSDKFRRLDTRPLLDSFMGKCSEIGLIPYQGVMGETKFRLRAVLPKVFEPIDNEPMVFGVEFSNSDYGDGQVGISLWLMRMWCTNLAVADRTLQQRHLGGRLPDDIQLSERTYNLDTRTMASAIGDVLADTIGPDRIGRNLEVIRTASEKEIRSNDGIEKRLTADLGKREIQSVVGLYNGPDTVNLPAGPTEYRLSNAVSFFAQSAGITPDRRIELQELAGRMLGVGRLKPREV